MEYAVSQGDCLVSIAKGFGFGDYRTIYDHPRNADFKRTRPDPNLLYPGDILWIPDKATKVETGATGKRHVFQLDEPACQLRLRLVDHDYQPFAGKHYVLTVAGVPFDARTSGDGVVEQTIPSDAKTGTLDVWLSDEPDAEALHYDLEIGSLDPLDETTGVQARLRNLAWHSNALSGVIDEPTGSAVAQCKEQCGMEATPDLDDKFVAWLRSTHDGL